MIIKVHFELSKKMLAVRTPCFKIVKYSDEIDTTTDESKVTCMNCLRRLGKIPKRTGNQYTK